MNDNIAAISCFFGKANSKVYPAPIDNHSYFFTNNSNIQNEAEKKGWKFIKIEFALQDDSLESALQAKYIKFLAFLKDFPEFKKYGQILYFDHRVFVKDIDVIKLLEIINENPNINIIIRRHERYRETIFGEIEEARMQERYDRHMDRTIKYVNEKIANEGISDKTDVCNTGLIFYNDYENVLPFVYEVYDTCINLQQPECQVIWATLSQKHKDKIKIIDFHSVIQVAWAEPFTNEFRITADYTFLYFILFVSIVLLLWFYLFQKNAYIFTPLKIIRRSGFQGKR
jgi:hypothetical protein